MLIYCVFRAEQNCGPIAKELRGLCEKDVLSSSCTQAGSCLSPRSPSILAAILAAADLLDAWMKAPEPSLSSSSFSSSSRELFLSLARANPLTLARGVRHLAAVLRLPASSRASWKLRLVLLYVLAK